MIGFDPSYLLIVGPGMILGLLAAWLTKSTFAKYSQVGSRTGLTGAEAAAQMLHSQGIYDVEISETGGFLSDHYDPRTHSLHLSPDVYRGRSLSSIGVACHEAGHALQKAHGYAMLGLRSALVPITGLGQGLAPLIFTVGLFMQSLAVVKIAIWIFLAVVIFSIVTLPVEWNASARAKSLMVSSGVIAPDEQPYAGRVLNAAFLTYVAGAVTAILTLVYFLFRAGLLGGGRRDD
jgi:Zn-dependent membrane protease YugP